jgi:hypothetical protein
VKLRRLGELTNVLLCKKEKPRLIFDHFNGVIKMIPWPASESFCQRRQNGACGYLVDN